jgi:hypothetical protein
MQYGAGYPAGGLYETGDGFLMEGAQKAPTQEGEAKGDYQCSSIIWIT